MAKPRYEIHYAPGGRTVESLILEKEEADNKRDRVMRALLAGVEKPTTQGWQENPAEKRMQNEKVKIQQFTWRFLNYARNHRFIKRTADGQWQYISYLAETMVKEKTTDRGFVYDSFGKPSSFP